MDTGESGDSTGFSFSDTTSKTTSTENFKSNRFRTAAKIIEKVVAGKTKEQMKAYLKQHCTDESTYIQLWDATRNALCDHGVFQVTDSSMKIKRRNNRTATASAIACSANEYYLNDICEWITKFSAIPDAEALIRKYPETYDPNTHKPLLAAKPSSSLPLSSSLDTLSSPPDVTALFQQILLGQTDVKKEVKDIKDSVVARLDTVEQGLADMRSKQKQTDKAIADLTKEIHELRSRASSDPSTHGTALGRAGSAPRLPLTRTSSTSTMIIGTGIDIGIVKKYHIAISKIPVKDDNSNSTDAISAKLSQAFSDHLPDAKVLSVDDLKPKDSTRTRTEMTYKVTVSYSGDADDLYSNAKVWFKHAGIKRYYFPRERSTTASGSYPHVQTGYTPGLPKSTSSTT